MVGNIKNINGYILAGGKSSRMGTNKGLLPFNDKPIVQSIIAQLQPAVYKTISVSNNTEYAKFGMEVISCLIKDKDPAGGTYTALNNANLDTIFVLGCDMPFITTYAIQFKIELASHSQITLPVSHGETEH